MSAVILRLKTLSQADKMRLSSTTLSGVLALALLSNAGGALAQHSAPPVDAPSTTMSLRQTVIQTEAMKIVDGIYMAEGFGNTFLVTTPEGNVIIDTSLADNAVKHKKLLDAVDDRAPKYIIVTHAHGDHIGGVPLWKTAASKVIQQEHAEEFMHYQERLKGFFRRRNAAQFGFELAEFDEVETDNYAAEVPADILFDKQHSFTLGGLTFDVISTPSETHDALSVWIPERKAVFVGDLYYASFPNIYTLRGTKPRWALDYVNSLQKIMDLEPEILIPSHGDPIHGREVIQKTLGQYKDAILYVHDAVVRGMNAGKSVDELAASIVLPDNLKVPEIYGRVDWSVRGIYLSYAGWFDGDPSTMLGVSHSQSHAELVEMAGGVDGVTARAKAHLNSGRLNDALALADIVLALEANNSEATKIRRAVFEARLENSSNFNEIGWLKAGIRETQKANKLNK